MSGIYEDFSPCTAPPGRITFSVLNQAEGGHSVSVDISEYPGFIRETRACLSGINASAVFQAAVKELQHGADCKGGECQCDIEELLSAFIAAMLKHPDKRSRKILKAEIRGYLKKNGGAHVILLMPNNGPSAWLVAGPEKVQ